jgi:pilus assembly protein Flp/PilA
MRTFFQNLKSDRKGATAIEYGLIAGLIAVVIVGAITSIGSDLNTTFGKVRDAISPPAASTPAS